LLVSNLDHCRITAWESEWQSAAQEHVGVEFLRDEADGHHFKHNASLLEKNLGIFICRTSVLKYDAHQIRHVCGE
jgi:hypothetical protein